MGGSGLGQFLSFAGMGLALLSGPAGWGIYGFMAGMGVAAIGGMMSQQQMKRDAEDALRRARESMAGLRVNSKTQLKAIQVLYGRARVGGNIVYMRTTGETNQDLHTLWGIGEGPIDGVEQLWFGDVQVWDAAKIGTNSGQLESPYRGHFDFDYRLGTNVQSRFSQVNAIDPDFTDRYPLVAMAYVKLSFVPEVYQGVPVVNFVVRGRILNRPWDAGSGWTDSPALVVYDQMTHPRYGLGVSTTAVNCGAWVAANSYCQEPPTVWDKWIEETVDQVSFGPRKFSETVPYHSIVDSADNFLGYSGNIGGGEGVKLPIRPGSLTIHTLFRNPDSGTDEHYWWHDVPAGTTGIMATTGTIVNSAGGAAVGSVDYYSGRIGLGYAGISPEATWFGGFGVVFRTKYQYLARSLSVICGSETLVETGTITTTGYLISSQGGWGIVDYTNGILEARLGGVDWYNFSSAAVRYKIGTLSLHRFSFNGGYVDAAPVLDQARDAMSHMRGFMVYAAGEYKLKTEKPGTSIYSFDDNNIVAGTFKVTLPSMKDKPNRVRIKYVDALQAYTPKDAVYDVGSPADIQGFEREYTMILPGCVYRDQAHRIAQTVANAAALGIGCSFEAHAAAADLEPGDIVDVTQPACSWAAKLFRIWYVAPGNDEKVEIRAFEHDDSIFADAWPYGDMMGMKASAYPRRSYFAPAVSSLTAAEVKQTLADGTMVPGIRMKVEATSGTVVPEAYRFYIQYETASRAPFLAYDGKNAEFTWGPAIPGMYNVSAYTVSDFGIQGNMGKSYSIRVIGDPEFEWMKWRVLAKDMNRTVIGSIALYTSRIPSYLHNDADLFMFKGTFTDAGAGYANEIAVYKMGLGAAPSITKVFSCHNDEYMGSIGMATSGHIGLYYWDAQAGAYEILKLTANSLTTVASAQWNTYSLGEGASGRPLWMGANSVGGFVFSKFRNNSLSGIRWATFSTGNMWVNTAWTSVMSSTQQGIVSDPTGATVWKTNSHFVLMMSGFHDTGSGYQFKISHAAFSNNMTTCVVSPHQVYLASKVCSLLTYHAIPGGGYQGYPGIFTTEINGDFRVPEGYYSQRRMLGMLTNPTSSNALVVFRETNVAINANDISEPFMTSSGEVILLSMVSSPLSPLISVTDPHEIKSDRFVLYQVPGDAGASAVMTWI